MPNDVLIYLFLILFIVAITCFLIYGIYWIISYLGFYILVGLSFIAIISLIIFIIFRLLEKRKINFDNIKESSFETYKSEDFNINKPTKFKDLKSYEYYKLLGDKRKSKDKSRHKKLKNKKQLPNEKSISNIKQYFFTIIKRRFGQEYDIKSQVRLSTITDPVSNQTGKNDLNNFIDFVLFIKGTHTPLLLIEIYDKSHLNENVKNNDIVVKNICNKYQLNLIVFWANKLNSEKQIVKRIRKYISYKLLSKKEAK